MWIAIVAFFILTVLYQILVTIISHGIFDSAVVHSYFSIGRDLVWILIVLRVIIQKRKLLKAYFQKYRWGWGLFIILTVFSIAISYWLGKSYTDILIGYKYSFYYLFIILSATIVGYLAGDQNILKYIKKGIIGLFIVVVLGYIWQITKLYFPDFFLAIGYGPLDNFVFSHKPPMYYLTGYQGMVRRQGLFAGPNNYGYFLLAFFPVVYYYLIKFPKNLIKNKFIRDIIGIIFWGITIALTLSRSAVLGMALALCLLNIKAIKKNKKLAIGAGIILLGAIIGLSILKYKSTLQHIMLKVEGVEKVIHRPLGYGLGTSGPSIHHNGTELPENYFVQILIDVGTVGFLLWSAFMFWFGYFIKKIKSQYLVSNTKRLLVYNIWSALVAGLIILLFMGLFLHVFEDSMVNYLLGISLGILTGYISRPHRDDSFE